MMEFPKLSTLELDSQTPATISPAVVPPAPITAPLFSAFLYCPYKAFLHIKGEFEEKNALEFSIDKQRVAYRDANIQKCRATVKDSTLSCIRRVGTVQADDADTILADVVDNGRNKSANPTYVPLLFLPTEKVCRQQRLALAFVGYALSKGGYEVASSGKIIHGTSGKITRVQLGKLNREAGEIVEAIEQIRNGVYVPPLMLNKHCKICRFSNHCRAKAIEKDDLSLLSSLSKKEILKLNKKGIFSVTQLSYTYRPRRRRQKANAPIKHSHALKALAIREKKIYVVPAAKPALNRVQVFFDVEGMPDEEFYYLIGAKVIDGNNESAYSFWADERTDEAKMWREFMTLLSSCESFSLLHFGSYDAEFVSRMLKRYGSPQEIATDRLKSALINVLTYCHLNIYFPTYSNGLKDIGTCLKFPWAYPGTSGLQSVHWRSQWAESRDQALKGKLLKYNLDDCEALCLLAKTVFEIMEHREGYPEPIVSTDEMRREHPYRFGRNAFAVPEFDYINKCAYFDYQRAKVYWRTNDDVKRSLKRKRREARRSQRVNKVILIARPTKCPACRSRKISSHVAYKRIIYDLRFNPTGVKKWITKFVTRRYQCLKCHKTFFSDAYIPEIRKALGRCESDNTMRPAVSADLRGSLYRTRQKYGQGLLAWIIYQLIGLRQSQGDIAAGLNDIFGFEFTSTIAIHIKQDAANFYEESYEEIKKNIQTGRLVHVDETRVSVKGITGYVWVFANLEETLYVYSDSREGAILGEILKDFGGIMVSDFYTAYDSIPCLQQRCLIHLLRDLNDDLYKNPFDEELKGIARAFGKLLKPIMATIDTHGLKARFLQMHKRNTNRFFEECLSREYSSELTRKYQTRFKKNQNRLFTFMDHDGVPWNNNNAENAVKGFARMRRVIGGSSTESGLKDSLILLSIAQTLRNKNVSFLDFLKSGERNLSQYLGKMR